jgi:hypothetical protein
LGRILPWMISSRSNVRASKVSEPLGDKSVISN